MALPTKPPVPVASTIIGSASGRPAAAHDCFAAATSSGMYAFCADSALHCRQCAPGQLLRITDARGGEREPRAAAPPITAAMTRAHDRCASVTLLMSSHPRSHCRRQPSTGTEAGRLLNALEIGQHVVLKRTALHSRASKSLDVLKGPDSLAMALLRQ